MPQGTYIASATEAGTAAALLAVTSAGKSVTGGAPTGYVASMGAIGATPNANGATITAGVLVLQPADGTYGGVVTTLAQTFVGNKTFAASQLLLQLSQNGSTYIISENSNAGTGAASGYYASNGTNIMLLRMMGAGYTTAGIYTASGGALNVDGSGGMSIAATHASGVLRFYTGGTTLRFTMNTSGQLIGTGTESAPSFSGSSSNTGFYVDGASGSNISTGGSRRIGISGAVFTFYNSTVISPNATSATGIVIKGLSSQSANLQEWQINTGTAYSFIDKDGRPTFGSNSNRLPLTSANSIGTTSYTTSAEAATAVRGTHKYHIQTAGNTSYSTAYALDYVSYLPNGATLAGQDGLGITAYASPVSGSATVSDLRGLILYGDISTGITVGSYKNIVITQPAGAGTITALYGIYIGNLTRGTSNYSIYTDGGILRNGGNYEQADATNIVLGTGTGTKIGTATSQKIAFWNKTPIIQPTTGITGATRVGGGGAAITDTDTFGGYTLAQLAAVLINTGLAA